MSGATAVASRDAGAGLRSAAEGPSATSSRMLTFDTLRGLAIYLMLADHLVGWVFQISVADSPVRWVTRLSEPLFATLFGYFLLGRSGKQVMSRSQHLLLAAIVVNLVFFRASGQLDILVTFLLVMLAYSVLGDRLALLLPIFLVFEFDVTGYVLDYPVALVLSQVALGMFIRSRKAAWPAWIFLLAFLYEPFPRYMSELMTIPAAYALLWASRAPNVSVPWLAYAGRRPLGAYVTQWVAVWLIAAGYRVLLDVVQYL